MYMYDSWKKVLGSSIFYVNIYYWTHFIQCAWATKM